MIRLIGKLLYLALIVVIVLWLVGVLKSNATLKNEVIRLHITANSDSGEDQAEKLMVKDAVLDYIQKGISNLTSVEDVENYIRARLADIEAVANKILKENGSEHVAKVKMGLKNFGKRIYEAFTLPSGVYKALQIDIGEGSGENWWCVVFPNLCLPANDSDFAAVAASTFGDGLVETIRNTGDYKIRFFLLDMLGKIENFLFTR